LEAGLIKITSELILRPIKLSDQQELFQLMSEIYPTAYSSFWKNDDCSWYLDLCYNPKNLEKELSRERSHYFFTDFQGKTVGILKYDFPFSPIDFDIPNAMKVHRLYLSSAAQGKGIAKEIMQRLEAIAWSQNLETIWLEVMEKSAQAKKFYSKMGFRKVFQYRLEFENLIPDYREIEIWTKTLEG